MNPAPSGGEGGSGPVRPWRPTRQQLLEAQDRTLPDVLAPGLKGVFCGINPGLYSAAIQRHFGRPGNRFWPTLHRSGFTDRLLSPFEERVLLQFGWGITNIAERATATAAELTAEELAAGGARLRQRIERFQPGIVAVLGVSAYRTAFGDPKAKLGDQGPEKRLGGARLWILPSPSGLNAHYRLDDLAELFAELREFADSSF